MMRSLNEWFARKANKQDECRGRFWEGPGGLAPFIDQAGADDDGSALPMLFADYVQLLEWTGRAVRHGAGWLRGPEPAVMSRMGIEPEAWLKTMSSHGIQSLSALGSAEQLEALARTRDKKWVRGQGRAGQGPEDVSASGVVADR